MKRQGYERARKALGTGRTGPTSEQEGRCMKLLCASLNFHGCVQSFQLPGMYGYLLLASKRSGAAVNSGIVGNECQQNTYV
jgi:hypothetical protein